MRHYFIIVTNSSVFWLVQWWNQWPNCGILDTCPTKNEYKMNTSVSNKPFSFSGRNSQRSTQKIVFKQLLSSFDLKSRFQF